MSEEYGIIYRALNTINGKVYIGQTVLSLTERIGDHRRKALSYNSRSHFHSAIKKYGLESFVWEKVDTALSYDELNAKEKLWIKLHNSFDPACGYNITKGGRSFEVTDAFRKKISETGLGRKLPEHEIARRRVAMAGVGNHFYGKKHTEEAKQKNREAHVGKKLSKEHVEKCVHRGESNHRAVLKNAQVIEIKRLLNEGVSVADIAKRYNVTKNTIKSIKYNTSWKWVIV